MKVQVFDLNGAPNGEVALPVQFTEEVREDVIRRAFHAYATIFFQPKGSDPRAGLRTTAEYYGRRHSWRQTINTGRSRLPRERLAGGRLGRVLRVPHAVKGRRAHPPKPQKQILERINKKEKMMAIRSAIAAGLDKKLVTARGHQLGKPLLTLQFPIVVDASFETLKKTSEVEKTLKALGFDSDIQRADDRTKNPTGIRRLRGRGKRTPRSLLIVVSKDCPAVKASRNLAGLDVATVDKLNAVLLAPGGHLGRLMLWTKPAVQRMADEKLYL